MSQQIKEPITKKGYDKLLNELKNLKEVERSNVAKEIDTARSHGDLKENAEYHAAKEKQSFIEKKIADLSNILSNVQMLDPSTLNHNIVSFGSTVKILNIDNDKASIYTIVGSTQSDPTKGFISFASPIAKNLLGKSVGDEVCIKLPAGETFYEILNIEYKELDF